MRDGRCRATRKRGLGPRLQTWTRASRLAPQRHRRGDVSTQPARLIFVSPDVPRRADRSGTARRHPATRCSRSAGAADGILPEAEVRGDQPSTTDPRRSAWKCLVSDVSGSQSRAARHGATRCAEFNLGRCRSHRRRTIRVNGQPAGRWTEERCRRPSRAASDGRLARRSMSSRGRSARLHWSWRRPIRPRLQ